MAHELAAIGLILARAKLLEGVATRLKFSSIVAYITVGIAFGALFELGEAVYLFFSVGVFFLFFLIGLGSRFCPVQPTTLLRLKIPPLHRDMALLSAGLEHFIDPAEARELLPLRRSRGEGSAWP